MSKLIRLLLFSFVALGLLVTSCKKDEPAPAQAPACQTQNTSSLTVENTTTNTYSVTYGSNQTATVVGNGSTVIDVPAGTGTIRVVQQTGFVTGVPPADLTLPYTGNPCQAIRVQIPQNPACQTQNILSLTVDNTSTNTYRVTYGNNLTANVNAGASIVLTAPAGVGAVRVVQQTGQIAGIPAADYNLNYTGSACQSARVEISRECQSIGYGEVTFVSNSNNPYRITVDGTFLADIPGNGSLRAYVYSGNRTLKATQISGFIFTPTIVEQTANVASCNAYTFRFP